MPAFDHMGTSPQKELIQRLADCRNLDDAGLKALIDTNNPQLTDTLLAQAADRLRRKYYGMDVYIRGLIEFTNYCKNNCYYCGIRAGTAALQRYRLSEEQILLCCREGYRLGFRTFVLQGGEDPYFTDDRVCSIVSSIRREFPECAITLSIGEKSRASYQAFFDAGANRYLLRQETADDRHYALLHPPSMSLPNRKRCLFDLKDIGYQVGAGFMVGSPYQTTDNLISDLRFLQQLQPDMIGIGPFIANAHTPFCHMPSGGLHLTLRLLSILRLMFPWVLLPATTALGTIAPNGREMGLQAGGNVVMPNLSPASVRTLYNLYDNKLCTGKEAAQGLDALKYSVQEAGYRIVVGRGDVRSNIKQAFLQPDIFPKEKKHE